MDLRFAHHRGEPRPLRRWQKATAIVPLVLLAGAWTSSLTGPSLAVASGGVGDPGVPAVPTTPFEQPASVSVPNSASAYQGGSYDLESRSGYGSSVASSAEVDGIPTAALLAYQNAADVLAKADPTCKLEWPLLAAIGKVESDHGRFAGNALGADGVARPGIYGIPLNGSSATAQITDTDGGQLDNDTTYDRAVGPMQFIPSTWDVVGVDGDSDGVANPQDLDDAAVAAGVYLCAGGGDLSTDSGASAAVFSYNHSDSYVDLVLSIASDYSMGAYSAVPSGIAAPAVVTTDPSYGGGNGGNNNGNGGNGGGGNSNGGGGNNNNGGGNGPDGNGGNGGNGPTDGGNGGDGPTDGPGGGGGNDPTDPPSTPNPPNNPPNNPGDGDPVDEAEEEAEEAAQELAQATRTCKSRLSQAGLPVQKHLQKCIAAYQRGGDAAVTALIANLLDDLPVGGGDGPDLPG